jgi:alkylhydroperoxidase/carboxymuconolactone decarboxylase family protein YurZ
MPYIDAIKANPATSMLSDKMKALLSIAASVQKGGTSVTAVQIEKAKALGATDREIHDTVLITAAFCMYNRYVDGLSTWAPEDRQFYVDRAPRRAAEGYVEYDVHK